MSDRTQSIRRQTPDGRRNEASTIAADLKRAAIFEVFVRILETISKSPNELTVSEAGIYAVVFLNDMKGIETHSKIIPEFLDLSPASISRKLNKLVSKGLVARSLRERVYYYSIPDDMKSRCYLGDVSEGPVNELFGIMASAVRGVAS